ncbi:MAG: RNA polymerase sigma factor RpoD, partial [Campylobacter sp.]|nr:RNA polymerase sigma factor RpoD [Campylobacter sp.]
MSAAKEMFAQIEELFRENAKSYVTFEQLVRLFDKAPTAGLIKKIESLAELHKIQLISAVEAAKQKTIQEAKKSAITDQQKASEANLEDEFDLSSESDLLEWSRSDSPVRMYLREMGQIPLLSKEEEIEISKKIELGEDIIIDAFCSVPYLIDFILDYKEPLINRERRVKELFRSFDEEEADEENDDDIEEDYIEDDESNETQKQPKKLDKRAEKVIESFKA